MTQRKKNVNLLQWLCTVLVTLAVLTGTGWLIWHVVLEIPVNILRAWALGITVLLPIASWASWYFGHVEATGRLQGIDQAVDKVMGAATQAASLRVGTAHAMRQAMPQASPPAVLPNVEIIRRLSVGDMIDV